MSRLGTAAHVWRFMAPLPRAWRVHQVLRSLLFPAERVADHLPPPRRDNQPSVLLDLGCGHGVFLAVAQWKRPDLDLVGLDLSQEKIAAARTAFAAAPAEVRARVRELAVMDIADFPMQSVDAITIIDVLYLVPMAQWEGVLRKCYDCLRPGGRLLLKEMDTSLKWKLRILLLEEMLAVRVLGWTIGTSKKFSFPPPQTVVELLQRVGFEVESIPVDRGYSVPHALWIGHKKARS